MNSLTQTSKAQRKNRFGAVNEAVETARPPVSKLEA